MNLKDFRQMRRQREVKARASARERSKAEMERLRKPWKDLASPLGFGPIFEALGFQRHVTPDPWDPSNPPAMSSNRSRDEFK